MSGGSFDYADGKLRLISEQIIERSQADTPYMAMRRRLGRILDEIADAVHAVEWHDSGDIAEEQAVAELDKFFRRDEIGLLRVARGCLDYRGGLNGAELEVFHRGIGTVISALEAATNNPNDSQVCALESIGIAAMKEGTEMGVFNDTNQFTGINSEAGDFVILQQVPYEGLVVHSQHASRDEAVASFKRIPREPMVIVQLVRFGKSEEPKL